MPDSTLSQSARAVLAERAYGSIYSSQYADAQKSGHANEMGRRLGLPADLVEADFPNMMAEDRLRRAHAEAQRNSTYARMMANPRLAKVAIDDDAMPKVATAVEQLRNGIRGERSAPRFKDRVNQNGYASAIAMSFRDTLGAAGSMAGQGMAGLGEAASELLWNDESISAKAINRIIPEGTHIYNAPAKMFRDLRQFYKGQSQQTGVQYENWYGNQAARGLESIPLSVAGLVMAARGNPKTALGMMSSVTGGQSYGEARDSGLDQFNALKYAGVQGSLEAAGEAIPILKYADDALRGSGFFKRLGGQVVAENLGEQFTGHFQDLNQWASIDANKGKTFSDFLDERPGAALSIALATTAATGVSTSTAYGLERMTERMATRQADKQSQRFLGKVMDGAAKASTRTASPSEFQSALEQQLQGTAAEHIYVDPASVRSLFQSADDLSDDAFWGSYADEVAEAEALGGDVRISLSSAATHLAGTPQWESIRESVRLSPGGSSLSEVAQWEVDFDDANRSVGEELAAMLGDEASRIEPVQKVHDAMRDKLMLAGYRPDTASQLATAFAQRQRTRADRLGKAMVGDEADSIEVRQVLPPKLASAMQAAEIPDAGLSAVIAEMKRGRDVRSDKARFGPSLLDFIVKRGGIEDKGGDIAAMGAANIGKGFVKKGQRKLIKPSGDVGMFGGSGNNNSPDYLAMLAWEAGYFPQFQERPDVNVLLDAISEGLAGRDTYVPSEATEDDQVREAAQELYALLDQQGIDPEKANPREIAKAVARYQEQQQQDGRGYSQGWDDVRAIAFDAEKRGVKFDLTQRANGDVVINMLDTTQAGRGEGLGTEFMQKLSDWADANDRRLLLTPDASMGASSRGRLVKFYKRFGFVENKGRAKDFEVSEGMVRPAKARSLNQPAYHGSPHIFDRFSLEHIGSGEGAQAYGWGLYFAGKKDIAEYYREALSKDDNYLTADGKSWSPDDLQHLNIRVMARRNGPDIAATLAQIKEKQADGKMADSDMSRADVATLEALQASGGITKTEGRLYEVDIPEDNEYLLWDKPLSEQPEKVQEALAKAGVEIPEPPKPPSDKTIAGILNDALKHARNDSADIELTINNDSFLYNKGLLHAQKAGVDTDDIDVGEYVVEQAKEYVNALMRRDLFTGEKVYRNLVADVVLARDGRRADEAASRTLHEAGIAGIKYLDGGSRTAGDGSHNYVIFDDSRVEIRSFNQSNGLFDDPAQSNRSMTPAQRAELEARQQQSMARRGGQQAVSDQDGGLFSAERDQGQLLQSYDEGARGRITFSTSGKNVIELFESRDLSTFIHETGHLYLEELRSDAEVAGGQLASDWQTVTDWFAAQGHPIVDGYIPTEAHELWARGFERYTMEGKSPSSALRKAFDAFRSWMLSIYKVVDNLRAPITPEIRDVMARLMATDEEIQAATAEQEIKALFTDAAQASMTEAEFADYQAATSEARDEAFDALLYRTMAPIRAARTKEHREREANVRAEVMGEVDDQPVHRAMRLIKAGEDGTPMRLSREWLIDTYGKDILDALPRQVPPLYSDKGTMDADVIAERSGFSSGDEMVKMLLGYEDTRQALKESGDKRSPRHAAIDEMTATIMAERYGDPMRDGSIEDEARALIHSEKQGEVIASELRALARRTGGKPTPYAIARKWARDRIQSGQVNEVISGTAMQGYQRSARNASKAAEKAMLARDQTEAFRQKQIQMLNNALIQEGQKAKEAVDVAVRRLSKTARRKTSKTIDQAYLDQAHTLLEQVEFRNRTQRDINRQQSFEEWAEEQRANGIDVITPAGFAASIGNRHWSRLSVEELVGLDDTVKQILHLGRLKQTLLDGAERRQRDEVIAEMRATAQGVGRKPPTADNDPSRSFAGGLKSKLLGADAALIKIEQIVDWLDKGNPNGVWNRMLFKPLADAQGREADMMRDYIARINEAIEAMPPKQARDWRRKVDTPELINNIEDHPSNGQPWSFYKDQIVMLALNMGNEGNRQRVMDGYGWNEAQVMAVLDRLMTAEDWVFVQSTWDNINGLWPDIEALEKRVNGVAPDKIDATPISTRHGTFAGGYFPAVYDPQWSSRAENNDETNLLEKGYLRANVQSSATKARAEQVRRPMLLSMGVITRHLGEVIHDITHREALIEAWRLVSDERVQRIVTAELGREYTSLLRPWLKHIANDQARNANSNGTVVGFFRAIAHRITIVGLGYRFMSSAAQIAGLPNIIAQIGERRALEGWARYLSNPLGTYREVTGKSAEMRDRFSTMDRDIVEMARNQSNARGVEAITGGGWFTKYALHGILLMDSVLTTAGWVGAYRKGLAEGMTEDEAIYAADKVIRKSQGAGGAKDQAAITREHQAVKLLTMFYSYFSALYSQQRDFAHQLRRVSNAREAGAAMHFGFWAMVAPPLIDALIRGEFADDGEDDESLGRKVLQKVFFGNIASIPGVRDVTGAIDNGFGYKVSPVGNIGEALVQGWGNVRNALDGDEDTEVSSKWIKQTMNMMGLMFAKPTGQIASTSQFGYDVATGESQPENIGDWKEGILTGKIEANVD